MCLHGISIVLFLISLQCFLSMLIATKISPLGHSSMDGEMRYRSTTHNTGANPHLNPDYYMEDRSREAGRYEQQVHKKMLDTWQRDGQPKTGWYYNVQRRQAAGPNTGHYSRGQPKT